jgi:hypothetical protein
MLYIAGCSPLGEQQVRESVPQVTVDRVEAMPNLPEPYRMTDWKEKALALDRFLFDWNNKSETGPLIWLDDNRRNVNQTTFGLYTDVRRKITGQGKMSFIMPDREPLSKYWRCYRRKSGLPFFQNTSF